MAIFPAHSYGSDVHVLTYEDKTILLVGTAHISRESVDLVKRVIEQEQPDCVCLELDEKRYRALTQKDQWQALDLKTIIKSKQLSTLIISLLMAAYQKRLGGQLGVAPGAELLMAAQTAKELQIPVSLCDRDIRITLRRAWNSTSWLKKGYLIASLLASLFDKSKISEDQLNALKRKDALSELLDQIGESLPSLKKVLIDERDSYLSEKIKSSPGNRIVAVVGAGHVAGIREKLGIDLKPDLAEITTIPPVSPIAKLLTWSIPFVILMSILVIGVQKGSSIATASIIYWILASGIPAAAGAVLSLAHPLTTISAFAAAPITTLSPLIGAGYVCAFVQVMVCPPLVQEFELAGQDIGTFSGWWRNRLLRVFLVFIFTSIGAAAGAWAGSYRILTDLFG